MSSVSIIGILNVTPDSFYDGGKFTAVDAAVAQALQMFEDGADIVEIGGESTGPNSKDVSLKEERSRTINVIKELRKSLSVNPRYKSGVNDCRIAIDTYKSEVAEEAIKAGAMMVNDVTAGRADPKMFDVVAEHQVDLVLMYAKDATPRTTISDVQYDDVVLTIKKFLQERKQEAIDRGVDSSKIILDPGLGHFVSSDPKYSFEIIRRLRELADLGSPILVSPSRKSFLAGSEKLKTEDRLPGTIAASVLAVMNGARFVRTHDVKETKRGLKVAEFVLCG